MAGVSLSAHILCMPYHHAPVYNVTLFDATDIFDATDVGCMSV